MLHAITRQVRDQLNGRMDALAKFGDDVFNLHGVTRCALRPLKHASVQCGRVHRIASIFISGKYAYGTTFTVGS